MQNLLRQPGCCVRQFLMNHTINMTETPNSAADTISSVRSVFSVLVAPSFSTRLLMWWNA